MVALVFRPFATSITIIILALSFFVAIGLLIVLFSQMIARRAVLRLARNDDSRQQIDDDIQHARDQIDNPFGFPFVDEFDRQQFLFHLESRVAGMSSDEIVNFVHKNMNLFRKAVAPEVSFEPVPPNFLLLGHPFTPPHESVNPKGDIDECAFMTEGHTWTIADPYYCRKPFAAHYPPPAVLIPKSLHTAWAHHTLAQLHRQYPAACGSCPTCLSGRLWNCEKSPKSVS